MSDTRFGVIVVTVAFAAILLAVLLMGAVEWLQALNVRKQFHTGRHVKRPDLPVLEGRGERAGWWQRITRDDDDEFDGDHQDGRDVIEAVEAANEDVPGVATLPTGPGPGYFHDDQPTEVVPAVQLSDGSYAGLSGTIPANLPRPGFMAATPEVACGPGPGQPHRWPRPVPHAGPAAWHPQRPPLQPWIQAILGAPTVEAWAWGWQQQRRLAITI
jgi:hypothetical protein